ncbi:hypothetical protein [Spirillospora sp. CA-294931]|uniref:hypothetical protein n=1 Tax=Spirillospora sp. CA-294931 TaxID=3240042 RepID=UPI003D8E0DAF
MPLTDATLQAARQVRDRTAARLDELTRFAVADFAAAWDATAPPLATALAALTTTGTWPSRAHLRRSTELRVALAALEHRTRQATSKLDTRTQAAIELTVHDVAAAQAAIAATQIPASVSLAAAFAGVTPATLGTIKRKYSGAVSLGLDALPHAMTAAIQSDFVRSRSEDAAQAVALALRAAEARHGAVLTRTLTIARTQVMDAHRAAAQAAQDEAADVLAGWVWVSRLTTETCPSCWAMHGTIHPLTEPGPLDHPSGRCDRIPVVKPWADLGIPGPEPASNLADARAAFDSLPRQQQLQIMGPGRLDLLTTGQITWAELARRRDNPHWRPSYAAATLTDLRHSPGA